MSPSGCAFWFSLVRGSGTEVVIPGPQGRVPEVGMLRPGSNDKDPDPRFSELCSDIGILILKSQVSVLV